MALSHDTDVKQILILRTAVASWCDALRAIEDVGVLFAVVVTVLLGLNYVGVAHWGDSSPISPMVGLLTLFLGQPFVLTALAIAVHRTLLLQRTDIGFFADYPRYLRYFGWVVLLLGSCQVPLLLLDFELSNEASSLKTAIIILVLIGILALFARILIFFPALA